MKWLESTNEMMEAPGVNLRISPLDIQAVELIGTNKIFQKVVIFVWPQAPKNLEAIGDKTFEMPVFLHGLTGTGKTTLAEYAAKHYTSKDAEMVYCSRKPKNQIFGIHTGIDKSRSANHEVCLWPAGKSFSWRPGDYF